MVVTDRFHCIELHIPCEKGLCVYHTIISDIILTRESSLFTHIE